MYSLTLPTGELIEYVSADSYSGPGDCFSALHCNSSCIYFRVNGGTWRRTQHKSMHVMREFLNTVECGNQLQEGLK